MRFRAFGGTHAAALYTLIALWATWPLARGLTHDVAWDLGDPVLVIWALAWNCSQLLAILGGDIGAGQRIQLTVPRGVWQGSRVRAGGAWALMGTTMAPGFDLADFEAAERSLLAEVWPRHRELIQALTR